MEDFNLTHGICVYLLKINASIQIMIVERWKIIHFVP